MVGVRGLEPRASCSQSRRATNCATPRYEVVGLPGRILPKQARYQLRYTRILFLPTADHPSALPIAPSYTGRLLCLPTIADFLLAVQSFSRRKSASLQALCRREARCIFRYRSTFTLITHLRQGAGCPTAMPGAWASPGHRTANRPLARVISSRGPW